MALLAGITSAPGHNYLFTRRQIIDNRYEIVVQMQSF